MLKFCKLSSKNKDRCYDAVITGAKAVFVAILITAGSTGITYYSNQLSQEKQIFTESRKEASDVGRKVTNKLSDRHFFALRAASGYHWKFEQEQRYKDYDTAVQRWNEGRVSMLVDIKRYFGDEIRENMFKLIKDFDSIHQQLMESRNLFSQNQPLPDLNPLLKEIYKMDDTITIFSDKMQERLQTGKVDIYESRPPIKDPKKN